MSYNPNKGRKHGQTDWQWSPEFTEHICDRRNTTRSWRRLAYVTVALLLAAEMQTEICFYVLLSKVPQWAVSLRDSPELLGPQTPCDRKLKRKAANQHTYLLKDHIQYFLLEVSGHQNKAERWVNIRLAFVRWPETWLQTHNNVALCLRVSR